MNPALALIIANVLWGGSPPIFKYTMESVPPFTLAFLRFFIATCILVPFTPLARTRRIDLTTWIYILWGGFFSLAMNISFFLLGLQRTASINAPIVLSSGPVFLYILSVVFLKERARWRILSGLLVALTGTCIIVFQPILQSGAAGHDFIGNLFYLAATVSGVIGTVVLKKALERVGVRLVSFYAFAAAALVFLPFAVFEWFSTGMISVPTKSVFGIGYGSVSALAFALYYYGLARMNAQDVGIFTYINPMTTIIVAWLLLHEQPGGLFMVGTGLVFAGIFIAEQGHNIHHVHSLMHVSRRRG